MGNSLLAVRGINHKYIVVERGQPAEPVPRRRKAPAVAALPATRFELSDWKTATVHGYLHEH